MPWNVEYFPLKFSKIALESPGRPVFLLKDADGAAKPRRRSMAKLCLFSMGYTMAYFAGFEAGSRRQTAMALMTSSNIASCRYCAVLKGESYVKTRSSVVLR